MQKQITKNTNLKLNVVMGILNAIVNAIMPLLSFIYVARKLDVEGFGINQFASTLVSNFTLFAALGIPLYATKKLAQLKDNKAQFKQQASEMFFFSVITSTLVTTVYLAFLFISPKMKADIVVYLIYGFMIYGNIFAVEWFYQATERFTYITIRNIIVKLLTFITLIVFVKKPDDHLIYAIIIVLSVVCYSSVNFTRFCKLVKPSLKGINIKQHIKPVLNVFVLNIAVSLYLYVDNIMLGFIRKEDFKFAVSQYTVAVKIPRSITNIICALNAVLMPRLAYNLSKKNKDGFNNLLSQSFSILLAWALPASIGIAVLADIIIPLLCGVEYISAISTTQILAFTVLFVTLINFIGIQLFYNIGKGWKTTLSCLMGVVATIILNLILIPTHSYFGAGIASLSGVVITFLLQIIIGYKDLTFKKFTWDNFVSILSAGIMLISLILVKNTLNFSNLLNAGILTLGGMLVYGLSLLIFNHKYLKNLLKNVLKKVFKQN